MRGGVQTLHLLETDRSQEHTLHHRPPLSGEDTALGHPPHRLGHTPVALEAELSAPNVLWRPGPAELQEGERAPAQLAGWIDEHLERFLSVSGGSPLERFEPASGLALLLLALTTPAQRQSASPFARWAEQIAHDFAALLATTTDQLDWSAIEQSDAQDDRLASLLVFPLLEHVGDLRFACSGRLGPLFDRRPAAPDLGWCFMRSLLYGDDYDALLSDRLAHSLALIAEPARCTGAALHDLARQVLFLTQFGRRRPEVLGPLREPLCAALPSLTLWRMQQGDYEMGAALLLCQVYAGAAPQLPFGLAASLLRAAIEPDSAVPGYAPRLPERADRFAQCYRANLISMAALAEAQRVALELRYAELRAAAAAGHLQAAPLQARAMGENEPR